MITDTLTLEDVETERLILRKVTPADYIHLFENYSKVEIMDFLGYRTEDEYIKEEKRYQGGYTSFNRSFVLFLVINKSSGIVMGACGYHNWIMDHDRAELGYWLHLDDFKEKGFMSEALKFVLDYGFRKMNLHRVEAMVSPQNKSSLNIMKKFGFVEEGFLRENYVVNEKHEDSLIFSKLFSEYNNNQ